MTGRIERSGATSSMTNPRVRVDLGKLRHNLNTLLDIAHSHGISVAVVTKVVCADARIVELVEGSTAEYYADSRLANLASIHSEKPRMLLRVASPSEAERVIEHCEMSLESELYTLRLLGEAAERRGKTHKVILMIDMGDLREGIFFRDWERIEDTARFVVNSPSLELYGVGVNLTCYGAIIPDENNLGGLVAIADRLRHELNVPLCMVSGGNSSTIGMVRDGVAPAGITNLRLGEAFVLGNDTAKCALMPGLYGDAFTLVAELVEVQRKPSKPIGTSGANAFGEAVVYEDRGVRRRGILAIGRQDVNAENLRPHDGRVEVLGASSDHLLVDLENAPEYKVGDEIEFALDYGNLLRVFTSAYVSREYVEEPPAETGGASS